MIDVEVVWCSIFISVLDMDLVVVQTALCPCFLVVISSIANIQKIHIMLCLLSHWYI